MLITLELCKDKAPSTLPKQLGDSIADHQSEKGRREIQNLAVSEHGARNTVRFFCVGITKDSAKPEVDVDSSSSGLDETVK